LTSTPDSSDAAAVMVWPDFDAEPPLWEYAPVPTVALPEPEPPGPDTDDPDDDVPDDGAGDDAGAHAAGVVGVVLAAGEVDAVDVGDGELLPVSSVSGLPAPHAAAARAAITISGLSARALRDLMPPGWACTLGIACAKAQRWSRISPQCARDRGRADRPLRRPGAPPSAANGQ
jgi:hypothetical protein